MLNKLSVILFSVGVRFYWFADVITSSQQSFEIMKFKKVQKLLTKLLVATL